MQVFKAFFKIAQKRLSAALIYFAIYAAITIVLSATTRDFYADQFKASSLTISITDNDASAASKALIHYLSSLHNVSDLGDDKDAILDRMYYRTLDYALTIPAGFEEKLLSGDTEELLTSAVIPGSNNSYYVDQQISQYLTTLKLYLAGGYDIDASIAATDEAVASVPDVKTVSFHDESKTMNSSVFYYFQYMPYVFIVILFSGLAPILVILNGKELKARTVCSSLTPRRRIGEMSAGCVLYSLGIWALFMLLCLLLYGPALWTESALLLAVLNSFVFLLISTALTLFISCFGFDDNILNMVSNMLGLSMAFLCGVFVPQSMLPASVLSAAKFLPAYWYIRANNMLAGFGKEIFDMNFYLQCIGIQLLYAVAIFIITFVVTRQVRRR